MEYMVPPELAPGIYRHSVGFFAPGDVLELPDAASKDGEVPHVALIPMDEKAHGKLLEAQRGLPDKKVGDKVKPHPLKAVKVKPPYEAPKAAPAKAAAKPAEAKADKK